MAQKLQTIELVRERIAKIKAAPAEVARRSAPIIQERLRSDATTRRGNVPSFGDAGNVPITARVDNTAIIVSAPDWVLKKAQQRGQVDEWLGVVQDVAEVVMGGG